VELGRVAVAESLRRARVDAEDVDDVAIGVNFPGSDRSIARQVANGSRPYRAGRTRSV
jgi:acetyl-CoA acetyltransferase